MEKKDLTQTRQYYGFLSLLLVLFALIPNVINAQGSSTITLTGTPVDIDGSTITQPVVVTGSTTDAELVPLTIKGGSKDNPVEVTLQDVTLSVNQYLDVSRLAGIVIEKDAYVKLVITGNNTIQGGKDAAGIWVKDGATLVVDAEDTNQRLTCLGGGQYYGDGGGAGIGACEGTGYGNIIILGGSIVAKGCKGGAGIGSGWEFQTATKPQGNIEFRGGEVTAIGSFGNGGYGYSCGDGIGSVNAPVDVTFIGGYLNSTIREGSITRDNQGNTITTEYKSYSGLTPGQEVDVYCWDNANSVKTKVSENGTLSFLAANNVKVFGDKKLIQTSVSDAEHASITPGGIYAVGDKVTLTVSVNDQQYAMTGWEDDKSNSNLTRKITVGDEDATYTANVTYVGDVPACVNNEYQIYNVNQLKWFRDLVNGTLTDGTERKKDANAKLMADIDLQYEAWTPMGKYDPWRGVENVYAGTFDGNNHTISNLKVENVYCCGFFGSVAGGHVKNLGIINADLKCSEGLIGVIAGTISHADIKNCYAVGDLKLNKSNKCETAAGIANYGEWSSIQNSYTSYSKVFDETNINHAGTENCQADIASSAHLTGELAYLLNSNKQDDEAGWGQAIGTDAHPVALAADNVVYKHGTAAEASTISLGTDILDRITTLCYPADVVLPNKVKAFTISSLEETDPYSAFARMDELKSDVIAANSPVVLMNTGGEAATLNLPAVSGYYSNNETASDIISQSGNLLKGTYSQMPLDHNKYCWYRHAFLNGLMTPTLSAYKCYFESEAGKHDYSMATNEPVGKIEYAVLSEEDNTCYVSRLFYAGIGTKDYTVSIPSIARINGKEYEVAQLGSCDDDSDNKSFGNMNGDHNAKLYINLPKTLKTVSKQALSTMSSNMIGSIGYFSFTTEEPPVFKTNNTDAYYYRADFIVPYAAEELYKAAWGNGYVNITSNKTELDIANGNIDVTGNEYKQGANTGTINETLVIKGTSTENNIFVAAAGTEDEPLRIAINGLSIDLSNVEYYISAISLDYSNVSLIVQGTNTLKKSPLAEGSIELKSGASLAINKLSTGTLDVLDGIDGGNVEVAAKVYDGLESFSYQNIKAGSTLGTNQLAFGLYAIPGVENFVVGGKCEKFVLSDAVNFYSPEAFTADAVEYKRTFEDNEFNSLYLPFSAKVDDFQNCEFYVINMFHQNDTDNDGVLDNITLEVDKVPAGSTLLPNHPYLFKYTGDNLDTEEVFNLSNIEVSATKTPSFECSSMSYKYEFVGNYQYKASEDYADYYVIGVDNTTGKTALVHPTTDLPAMRWAMKMTPRESQFGSASLPLPAKMFIHINGEDNTTGISNVATEDSGCEYYGLDGVCKDKMAKGINIVKMKNGRVVKMVRR